MYQGEQDGGDTALPQGAASKTTAAMSATASPSRKRTDTRRDDEPRQEQDGTKATDRSLAIGQEEIEEVYDGDQVARTGYRFMQTTGTLNDGLRKLAAWELRRIRTSIADRKRKGVSSVRISQSHVYALSRRF